MAELLTNIETGLKPQELIKALGARSVSAEFKPEVTTVGSIGEKTLGKDGLAVDGGIQSFKEWL